MSDIEAKIKAFLASHFQNIDVREDQDIFDLGFINSLFAMQLVLFVEHEFALTLTGDDLELDNFRTIAAIAKLIRQKEEMRE